MKWNGNRRERIEQMKAEIERRGGLVGLSPDAPDWLTEKFLRDVLACPDCRAEAARRREH
jgi:hypothetical protein